MYLWHLFYMSSLYLILWDTAATHLCAVCVLYVHVGRSHAGIMQQKIWKLKMYNLPGGVCNSTSTFIPKTQCNMSYAVTLQGFITLLRHICMHIQPYSACTCWNRANLNTQWIYLFIYLIWQKCVLNFAL